MRSGWRSAARCRRPRHEARREMPGASRHEGRSGAVSATEATGVEEVHILWTWEGLSCDGDSVSMTAGTLPSIEEVALGLIPGLPKVHLHNKVLSPTLGGEEFMAPFRAAARDELDAPFVFV